MSVEALIAAHTAQQWEAAFLGFAPGFAYLRNVSTRPLLAGIPRRDTPRTAVPAGSVALADDYSTVYPHASPGGWQLIGRTDTVVWDLSRPEPALITAGTPVRFRACRPTTTVRATPVPDPDTARSATAGQTPARPGLQVIAPGMQSLYQDRGRTGFAHLGVSGSGAADRASAARANRLVGNPPTATVIETAIGGLHLVAESDEVLVVTGAEVPLAIRSPRGDWEPGNDTPFALREGDHLILGSAVRGRLATWRPGRIPRRHPARELLDRHALRARPSPAEPRTPLSGRHRTRRRCRRRPRTSTGHAGRGDHDPCVSFRVRTPTGSTPNSSTGSTTPSGR